MIRLLRRLARFILAHTEPQEWTMETKWEWKDGWRFKSQSKTGL